MLPLETLAPFFMASILLALAPGPDNIFVLTQSALRGRVAGLLVTLGLCTGLIVHTTAVAFGVAVIFKASALAFTALKLFGAGYLLYLAWLIFRSSAETIATGQRSELSYARLYRRGIIMNVTNPKVSIFFLAFLPQFADPARGSLTLQMLLLGGVFIVSTILVFGGIAFLAGSIGGWLNRSPRTQMIMNRLAGMVFVGLAVKLATVKR
ncbi:threonine transporter RhtB [Desulfosarcina ovata subsp. sediminis]|uniref:Threonine transporter RhtB n=1 Tax=Desulfosarcina ovata subsp. sediminis TaxID=885957 RepID=A0A5K7ZX34_9BACT|nr:LysE family translocator [Desulfosarcina ovata]BBO84819.1 threonine transporter RhtB [Desulfosarcina ovata subsp. sediminis]